MKKTPIILLFATAFSGIALAWIDSRPNWDDTGISVLMILVVSTLFGYFSPQKPWITALAVSGWIPVYGIVTTQNFGSLLAIIPGFAGAFLGLLLKKR
ncbi:MAG: hypothetical protein WCJ95_05370 [Mariniphaga sp.]